MEMHDAQGVQLSAASELSYLHGGYGQLFEALENQTPTTHRATAGRRRPINSLLGLLMHVTTVAINHARCCADTLYNIERFH